MPFLPKFGSPAVVICASRGATPSRKNRSKIVGIGPEAAELIQSLFKSMCRDIEELSFGKVNLPLPLQ